MATLKITERPQVPALKNGASLLITQQETVDGKPVEALRRIEANPLLAPPIIKTAQGEVVTINDSANRPFAGLRLYGKTTQKTTAGYNLLSRDDLEQGLQVSQPGDAPNIKDGYGWRKEVTVDMGGTEIGRTAKLACLRPNVTYTLSFVAWCSGTGKFTIDCYPDSLPELVVPITSTPTRYTWTFSSNLPEMANAVIRAHGHNTGSGVWIVRVTDIQLEEGSVAHDYEPYTGGYASPSPNWKQPLVNVGAGGSIGVYARGKNLLTNTATTKTINGVTFTANEDYSVTAKGTASQYAPYEVGTITLPAGTYILSGAETVGKVASESDYIRIVAVVNGSGICSSFGPESTFVLSETTTLTVRLDVTSGTAVDGTFWPIVRSVSEDAVYETPKDGGSVTVSTPNGLPGIPVTSGGNYIDASGQQWVCDEKDYERGVYVQRVGARTLNGTETWYTGTTLDGRNNRYTVGLPDKMPELDNTTVSRVLCNAYPAVIPNEGYIGTVDYGVQGQNDTKGIIINDARYPNQNLDGFKASLAANPITVMYVLATPIETPIPADELAAYRAITSQKPTTTVYNDAGAGLGVDYIADTELWSKASQTSMIGAIEPGMVASKNYAAGDFIVDQDTMTLYRATAPIAKGEAIKPGTNCTATTVVEQLAALYSLINR